MQFVVADAGIGIPQSLRAGHPSISSDTDALDRAIREGVTRDTNIGQGNGLFGTFSICSKSKSMFSIVSDHARLHYTEKNGLHISCEKIPYAGTMVVAEINFENSDLLAEALNFGGERYQPVDYIETFYETETDNRIVFRLRNESESFGSRTAGTPVRNKIKNLLRMSDCTTLDIDLSEIPVVSSSFANEVIGKLFLELGPLEFMKRIRLLNMTNNVESLINRAISQRMSSN